MLEQQKFSGTITVVEASRANEWLKSGLAIFVKQRKTWMLMMLFLMAFGFLSMTLSVVGLLALKILTPVLLAGLMQSCLLLEKNTALSVFNLFDGFQNRFSSLVRIGLLYTSLHLLAALVLAWFFTANAGPLFLESLEKLSKVLAEGGTPDFKMLVPPPVGVFVKTAILWIFLSIPALMLLCFSPLLARLYGVDVHASIRLSFTAVWRNRAAFLTLALSLVILVLLLLSPIILLTFIVQFMATPLLPLLLMMVYFILMLIIRPILIASIYAAHKDVFGTGETKSDTLIA